MSNVFQRGLSRISRRKKRKELFPAQEAVEAAPDHASLTSVEKPSLLNRGMDRIRRSIRKSFRKRHSPASDRVAELAPAVSESVGMQRTEQWRPDEESVRNNLCSFSVKYLGAIEVFDSRGMSVCEGALKQLRLQNTRRRPVKAYLHVSGDGIRVVDQENNRGLIVDQTIEKVSFCAPDRTNPRGFAYICRDGTSRRWMCHGFQSSKDSSGERLSHAVGCAFTVCLEKKRKREEDTQVTSSPSAGATGGVVTTGDLNSVWDDKSLKEQPQEVPSKQRTNPTYQSFRKQLSITERLQDPQSVIVNNIASSTASAMSPGSAKPRPVANPTLFHRQGSLRAPEPAPTSSFRRNQSMSMRAPISGPDGNLFSGGQSLHNEPILEGDEDHHINNLSLDLSRVQSPPSTRTAGPDPLVADLIGSPLSPEHSAPFATQPQVSSSSLLYTGGFGSSVVSSVPPPTSTQNVLDNTHVSQMNTSFSSVQPMNRPTDISTAHTSQHSSTNGAAGSILSSRNSKADEWLEGALRTSLCLSSPTSPQHSNGYVSQPQQQTVPQYSSLYPALESPSRSGPPPAHPPPPLPSKNCVVKNNQHNEISPSPVPSQVDAFGQSVQWDTVVPTIAPRPEDPFDIQWSRISVNQQNPFAVNS